MNFVVSLVHILLVALLRLSLVKVSLPHEHTLLFCLLTL